ncbi:BTB/POZ domain-containing protein [archaeon]|nr:MAG: BTB/POZ domain-containing protein [archaeon]
MLNAMFKDSSLGFRVEDTVIFKVEVTVYGDLESSPILDHDKSFPNVTTLETSIKNMFNDPNTADVILKCGSRQERIFAHRCILSARSEVFRAMFTTNCRECVTGEVNIPDIDYMIMKEVVFHIYSDAIPDKGFLAENSLPLLLAAMKYQLHFLQESLESQIAYYLSPETAPSLLMFADNINCPSLKRKVLVYLAQNANRIMQMKEFRELDGALLAEANAMIDFMNKKRGCRGAAEKERKVNFGCSIM